MKIRGFRLFVQDMEVERAFWTKFLNATPKISESDWVELKAGDALITLLPGQSGSGPQPVFEYSEIEMHYYIQKAQDLGATLVEEGLNNPRIRGAVLRDPEGNEFQVSRGHR